MALHSLLLGQTLDRLGWFAAVGAAVAFAACGRPAEPRSSEVTLRVGAPYGLSAFTATKGPSGATAYALNLGFDRVLTHVRVHSHTGNTVLLEQLPSSTHATTRLARALRAGGLVRASAKRRRTIEVEFVSASKASSFVANPVGGFDVGPFVLDHEERGQLRLRSRGDSKIDVIDIREVDLGQQWRALLGRQIHVIPNMVSLYRSRFAGLRTIRVLDLPVTRHMALLINVRSPTLSGRSTRLELAAALDLTAIALVACGAADCATAWPQHRAQDASRASAANSLPSTPRLPKALTVLVLASHTSMVRAAEVIRSQLHKRGTTLSIEHLTLKQIAERGPRGDFELLLAPVPSPDTPAFLARFSSLPRWDPYNWTGYSSRQYDSAFRAKDTQGALRLLAADVPGIVLFEMREFAAVDARFCGGTPSSPTSWRWLAELYPCSQRPPS